MLRLVFIKSGFLRGCGLGLILCLPVTVGHAVDDLASCSPCPGSCPFRQPHPGIPIGQAIPAEPRKVHHVNVLNIGTPTQVLDQPAENGSFQLNFRLLIHINSSPSTLLMKPSGHLLTQRET
jgi:hypothetical protein